MSRREVVQMHGVCNDRARHEAHVFLHAEFESHRSFWDCPGVFVDCLNCDDRKCMDCVLRYMHDRCEESCPECCS